MREYSIIKASVLILKQILCAYMQYTGQLKILQKVCDIPLPASFQLNINMSSEVHHSRVCTKWTPQQKIRQADDHNQRKYGPWKHRAYSKPLKYYKAETPSNVDHPVFPHVKINS